MSYALPSLLLLSAASAPATDESTSGDGKSAATDSAAPWTAGLGRLLDSGGGRTLTFRYRKVDLGHEPSSANVVSAFDGVFKLTYAADGFWTEEVGMVKEREEDTSVVPRRALTFYSAISGDRSRECSRADGQLRTVYVDRWSGPPPLALYALRKVFVPGELDGFSCVDRSVRSDGLERVLYTDGFESEVELFLLPGDPPELDSVRIDYANRGSVEWIHFDGYSHALGANTNAPAMITDVHIDRSGKVSEATVWAEVTGDWASRAVDPRVRPGAGINDYRDGRELEEPTLTDRQTALDELLTWPSVGLAPEVPPQQLVVQHDEASPPDDGSKRTVLLLGLGSLAAGIAVLGWKTKEVRS